MNNPTQELKVLLIEDNPGDAFLMKFYLGESASPVFHVSHAENLKSALDLLAENTYDIILSDMNMPDSNGVETVKTLLSKYPGNLVIVLTGLTDEQVGLETVRYGAQDFLVKGKFDGKVLVSSVLFAFERFKLNNQLDEGNFRLNTLQEIAGVGYFETDNASQKSFFCNKTIQLLGSEDETKRLAEQSMAVTPPAEFNFASSSGATFGIKIVKQGNKICGVVVPKS
ncbi:MAG: response regulator [Chitinophagales bacterium]|nr:response regulator [Chitinophagales bacterium]MDW8419426.1 response regulator [Chitinophagales bacterium]